MTADVLIDRNRAYWTRRAQGYSQVNRRELRNARQRLAWQRELCGTLDAHFAGRARPSVRVLDAGTGPGFFAMLLAEAGYRVTAVDLTPAMLDEARCNAGPMAERIAFAVMDAEHLSFADASFDAVVSRNLTWNLPAPQRAYCEWNRVLVPGGMLINYDANWYRYLFDPAARTAWDADRRRSTDLGAEDDNVGDGFDAMEQIAREVPLSRASRPDWDLSVLVGCGMEVSCDTEVWKRVWTRDEKICMASTPLFRVTAVKR